LIPWKLLGTAQTSRNGAELRLYQRDTEFSIKADNQELMNSQVHGSEDALAKLACEKVTNHPDVRVLIGGLGLGYTLRAALDELKPDAEVVVAEIVPEVVQWNRDFLGHLAGSPLDDHRVKVEVADVAQMINTALGGYNAIMLDVDNGPQAMTQEGNEWIYGYDGLESSFAALRPKGVLSIWSTDTDPAFTRRLLRTGFKVEEVKARARSGKKGGGHYFVWVAIRP
jgi:spermidine synthase